MPHLTLEYTSNLSSFDAMAALHALNQALIDSGHFEEFDIKSRALVIDTFLIGSSDEQRGFIHVRLALLSGRSAEVKTGLSHALLNALGSTPLVADGCRVQLCAEIIDIDRASYAKGILPG